MNKKKNKIEKWLLLLSIVIALTITVCSTFAWLTSRDEVTNRLSADGKYGVSILEDFTPPIEWLPGEEVTKNVKAINTGNIPTFIRMSFDHTFTVKNYGEPLPIDESIDLSQCVVLNSDMAKAIQTGGYVIVKSGDVQSELLQADEQLYTADGLYVFKYSTKADETEYDGFYIKNANYYAVTIPADYSGQTDDIKLSTYGNTIVAKDSDPLVDMTITFIDNNLKEVSGFDDASAMLVTFDTGNTSAYAEIPIYIYFPNDVHENYAYIDNYFYYKKVTFAGETTSPLVEKVALGKSMQVSDYLELNYDLNVELESIQVACDSDGNYTADTAKVWRENSDIAYNGSELTVNWQ